MKRHRRRPSPKPRTSADALERLHPHAAGIDCGSAEHFVAVPPDRDATAGSQGRVLDSNLRDP
jgi:transposase